MAAWIPLLKTALPYVVQVLSVAIPAFTSKAGDKKTSEVIPEQIVELQSAATECGVCKNTGRTVKGHN